MSATMKILNPAELYDASPIGMSQAVIDVPSGLVFVSGQVAWDRGGKVMGATVAEQTKVALEKLTVALAAAGCTPRDVRSVRIYVRGEIAEHLPECGPLLGAYFGPTRPALTGLGVASLATPDTLVEVEVIAHVPQGA
jgi:2-iminobutanoate/2-iminopropanoate deaminase